MLSCITIDQAQKNPALGQQGQQVQNFHHRIGCCVQKVLPGSPYTKISCLGRHAQKIPAWVTKYKISIIG